jgi:hypothetical protein
MAIPSIKGSTIAKLVDDVRRLRDAGDIAPDELEARLDAEALALLDTKFNDAGWYPLATYEQYAVLLLEVEGKGDPAYLHQRGQRAGERLVESGLYQQLEYLGRRDRPRDFDTFLRDLRLVNSLTGALLNVGRWQVERDPEHPERAMIVGRELEGYPDVLCHTTAGFFTGVAARSNGGEIVWHHERPGPDEVFYRMDRDFSNRD